MYKYVKDDQTAEKYMERIRSMSGKGSSGLTLRDALFNPQYRKGTWVNIGYMVFHELTGINVINLYSHKIFQDMKANGGGINVRDGVTIVGIANLIASLISTQGVKYIGRRTLLIYGHIGICLAHAGVAIFNIEGENIGVVIMVIVFMLVY